MSEISDKRSAEFLKVSGQFQLGALVTESSHPVTANLSEVAGQDSTQALDLLFQVDGDVVAKYGEFAASGRAVQIKQTLLDALRAGGRVFFTGCGSTGRLSIQLVSIWRDFWQRQRAAGFKDAAAAGDWEQRALSVMAGGDFALIKSVEGFEDFAAFGRQQIRDLKVSDRDVVFAITEGGETSFVIGTAWEALAAGARVYFVYNNPDDVLCNQVQRSREIIEETRIEKINLTTGPMAITGSTRMQATSIQLCVLLTVMEMVLRDRMSEAAPDSARALVSSDVPSVFSAALTEMHRRLRSPALLDQLAGLVALEESVYRSGRKVSYYADRLGIDVLTDTTERSPTYCTPPFRKFDDPAATESWAFLFLPHDTATQAWERLLKRPPCCIEWNDADLKELVDDERGAQARAALRRIGREELTRFKIGRDGLPHRPLNTGDAAVGILAPDESKSLLASGGFLREQLEAARKAGARTGLICFIQADARQAEDSSVDVWPDGASDSNTARPTRVNVPVPNTNLLLDGVTRVGVKMLLNALSTATMVRLGRVMGNTMIWVVASNLKLVDRATRYIETLTGRSYPEANRLLFEVLEYVEPRMKADQAYPPVVGLAVLRARQGLSNEEAETRLMPLSR